MKFSHKIVAASVALLLFTVITLTVIQYVTLQSKVRHQLYSGVDEVVDSVTTIISKEISSKKEFSAFVKELVENASDRDEIQAIIERPTIKKQFIVTGIGFESDAVVVENDPGWDPTPDDYNPKSRPWYQAAKEQNAQIITEPYLDPATGDVVISIAEPIASNGQFAGVTFSDVSLAGLAELVNNTDLFGAGHLLIVEENGTVIAHPQKEMHGKQVDEFLAGVRVTAQEFQPVVLDGQEFQVRFSKVPGEKWFVGAVLDESVALAGLRELRFNSAVSALIAVVVSIAILLVLIKALMRPLRELNVAINEIASGHADLTRRIAVDSDKELSVLAVGFNAFTVRLQEQVTQLKAIGDKIMHGAESTAESSRHSADAMMNQKEELGQLAEFIQHMTTASSNVATSASGAADAAREVDQATHRGTSVVNQTTESIGYLSEQIDQAENEVQALVQSADNIDTVLQVINDIADQTNLLALNAAIEAARAGEQGRGFAVVADEVRSLAQRTQESTTEIKTMIESLQSGANSVASSMNLSRDKAHQTVTSAQEASEALQSISEAIQNIMDMNIQIASSSEEQSLVVKEVNNHMSRINELTEQVAEMAITNSDSMQAQMGAAREQSVILDKFTV